MPLPHCPPKSPSERRADVLEWDGLDGSGRACGYGVYFVRAVASHGQRKTATLVRLP